MADELVRPFTIDIDDEVLEDLEQRLSRTRWPERELVDDWSQGIPLAYVQEVVEYWRDEYDWRAREARLNRFPQFMTEIGGCDIHVQHVRCTNEDAMPLLITHGWPGSFIEFDAVIEPLSQHFHLVCPSLPGYGFSGKPSTTGWGVERMADVWVELMTRLGYDTFGAQGGDWGAVVTTMLGSRHPERLTGIHVNMALRGEMTESVDPSDREQAARAAIAHYLHSESGYSTQQRTRPQTLGYGLTDSAVGQLAWILEKFHGWTDNQGFPEDAVSRDQLLDNVMLYWCTASATSSARLYWESFGRLNPKAVPVPTGVACFPKEILPTVRPWSEPIYTNIRRWTEMPRGGHFAALEQPELFIDDVRTFFSELQRSS